MRKLHLFCKIMTLPYLSVFIRVHNTVCFAGLFVRRKTFHESLSINVLFSAFASRLSFDTLRLILSAGRKFLHPSHNINAVFMSVGHLPWHPANRGKMIFPPTTWGNCKFKNTAGSQPTVAAHLEFIFCLICLSMLTALFGKYLLNISLV